MKSIKKILVPTDFSPASAQAFSYALWLADHLDASIDLLHVIYPGTDVMDFPAIAAQTTKVQLETAGEVMKLFTNEALTRLQSTDDLDRIPEVRSKIEVGSAASVISDMVEELNSDLIVIGTRGEHSRLEVAFGSVTTSVIRKSHIPVLVVPEELHAIRLQKLGYATSLDDSDPMHIWTVAQLLSKLKPTMHIVHVHTEDDKDKSVDLDTLKTFLKEKSLGLSLGFHEIHGVDPEDGLEQFAKDEKLDLLVMYSPKRNLFERIGHRSLTKKMVLYSHVPLLVVK